MDNSTSMALVSSTGSSIPAMPSSSIVAPRPTNVLAKLFASAKDSQDQTALVAQIQETSPAIARLMQRSEAAAQAGAVTKASLMLVQAINTATAENSLIGPTVAGMAVAATPMVGYSKTQSSTPFAITSFGSSESADCVREYNDVTVGVAPIGTDWDCRTFTGGAYVVSMPLPPHVVVDKVRKTTKKNPDVKKVFDAEDPSIDPAIEHKFMDNGMNYHGIVQYASHTSKTLADTLRGLAKTPPTCLILSTTFISTDKLCKTTTPGDGKAWAMISSGMGRVLAIDETAGNIDKQVKSCALDANATTRLETLLEAIRGHNTPLRNEFPISKTASAFFSSDYLRQYLVNPIGYPLRFVTVVQKICNVQVYMDDTINITYSDASGQPVSESVADIKAKLAKTAEATGASDVIMISCSVVVAVSKKRKVDAGAEAGVHPIVVFVSREHMFRSLKMDLSDKRKVKSTIYKDLVNYIKNNGVLAGSFKGSVDLATVSFIVSQGNTGEIHPENMPEHVLDVKPAEPKVTQEEFANDMQATVESNPHAINASALTFISGTAKKRIRFDVKPLAVLLESYLNMDEYDICDPANTSYAERIQVVGEAVRMQDALKFNKVDPKTDPCVRNAVYAAWMGAHAMSCCDMSPLHRIISSFVADVKRPMDESLAIFWEATCFFACLTAAVDTVALEGVKDEDRYICIDGYKRTSSLLSWAESQAQKSHPVMSTKNGFYDSHVVKFSAPGYFMHLWDIGHRIHTNLETKAGKTYAQILAETPQTPNATRIAELKAYFAKIWADAAPNREEFRQEDVDGSCLLQLPSG